MAGKTDNTSRIDAKRALIISATVLLLIGGVLVSSCGSNKARFVGQWTDEEEQAPDIFTPGYNKGSGYLRIYEDGTFDFHCWITKATSNVSTSGQVDITGTYSVFRKGDTVRLDNGSNLFFKGGSFYNGSHPYLDLELETRGEQLYLTTKDFTLAKEKVELTSGEGKSSTAASPFLLILCCAWLIGCIVYLIRKAIISKREKEEVIGKGAAMAGSINSGDSCEITRDIVVSSQVAFKDGEHVVVEGISPSPKMPEFKYVVYSRVMQQRFQLSENDIKVSDDPPREEARVTQSHEIKKVKYCATCGNVLNENGECRSCSRAHSVTLSSTSPRSPKPTSIRAAYNPYAIGIGVTELIVGSGFALLTIIAFSYIGFDYHSPPAYIILVVYLGYSIAMILSGIAACKGPVERLSKHFILGAATVLIFILYLLVGGADAGGGQLVLSIFMFLIGGVVILTLTFMIRAKLLSPETSISQAQSAGDTKTCPYCAETIKAAAIKCRFCGADLSKNAIFR